MKIYINANIDNFWKSKIKQNKITASTVQHFDVIDSLLLKTFFQFVSECVGFRCRMIFLSNKGKAKMIYTELDSQKTSTLQMYPDKP